MFHYGAYYNMDCSVVHAMKYLVEEEKDRIRFTRIRRKQWSMISTRWGKLYRIDDAITIKDSGSPNAMVIYPADGQQPRTSLGIQIDPDNTRALIDSAKNAKTDKQIWGNLGRVPLEKVLTTIVVGGGIIWYVLSQLGM